MNGIVNKCNTLQYDFHMSVIHYQIEKMGVYLYKVQLNSVNKAQRGNSNSRDSPVICNNPRLLFQLELFCTS